MKNIEQLEAVMQGQLKEMFTGRDHAWYFLCKYCEYCHAVDDNVDEEKSIERVELQGKLAAEVYNSNYWKQRGPFLQIVDRLIHNTYFDTVKWENSEEEWKKQYARVLSSCAYNMVFAIILIEFGEEKLKEVSIKFREFVHLKQRENVQ